MIYDDGSISAVQRGTGRADWNSKATWTSRTKEACPPSWKKGYTLEIEGDVLIKAPNIKLEGAMEFKGDIDHTGQMTTHGHHTDDAGTHQNALRQEGAHS